MNGVSFYPSRYGYEAPRAYTTQANKRALSLFSSMFSNLSPLRLHMKSI
jgi:hypothetical protein